MSRDRVLLMIADTAPPAMIKLLQIRDLLTPSNAKRNTFCLVKTFKRSESTVSGMKVTVVVVVVEGDASAIVSLSTDNRG